MNYRSLGKTDLRIGEIALGTEHLNGQTRETVTAVIRQAAERGVNYFDIVFALPDYLDNLGAALHGIRDRVLLAAHLGSTVKDGQYCRSRSPKTCERVFNDVLTRLGTGHVDVLFLHNYNSVNDWTASVRPGGFVDLALRMRDQGLARCIGMSGHSVEVVQHAVEAGVVDVVMLPVNLLGHAMPGRRQLQELCVRHGVGLLAMKPLGGGKLLMRRGTIRVPGYQVAGPSFQASIPGGVTAVQCLSYSLAQVGVCAAVVGVRSTDELAAALHTHAATETERDFSGLLAYFGRYQDGDCVYCNHCLPCPEQIDIGQVNRLLDRARWGLSTGLRAEYSALAVPASACTGCDACVARCPFGVSVSSRVRQAADLFAA